MTTRSHSTASIHRVSDTAVSAWGPLACFAVTCAGMPPTIALLRHRAALDVPSARSSHTLPTPRGGGAAIIVGILVATAVMPAGVRLPLIVAVAGFGLVGLAEDLHGVQVLGRFTLQLGIGVGIAVVLLRDAGAHGAAFALTLIVAVWVTGYANVFNFMDGVNGISGAHAVVGGAMFALLGLWRGDPSLATGGALIAAGGAAFLPWNAVHARVFLGDSGSYALGAALAVLAAYAVIVRVPLEAAIAPLALYLADTAWTLQRRIRAGENWSQPHRTHVYQRLCDIGWSHPQVAAATAGAAVVVCLLGAVSLDGDWPARAVSDAAAVALLAGYLCAPKLMHRAEGLAAH